MDIIARVEKFPEVDGQAPVTSLKYSCGGSAANTAVACAALGLKAGFIGRIGQDNIGKDLLGNFKACDIDISCVVIDPGLPSGQVFIASETGKGTGQKMMYAYPGAPQALSVSDITGCRHILATSLVVHMASLRVIEPFLEIARIAREPGSDFLLSFNPGTMISKRGYDEIKDILDAVDLLVLSRNELESIFGLAGVDANVKACFSKTNVQLLVVTFGSRGSNYFTRGCSSTIAPIFHVPTVNTTGAGDAFCAGFMASFLDMFKAWQAGQPPAAVNPMRAAFSGFIASEGAKPDALRKCLLAGNAVSSFVVQSDGAQDNLPTMAQVEALVKTIDE